MAAVFCASFRRRAMVWRSRVIFTRSSRAASSAGDGRAHLHGGGRLRHRRRRAAARSIAASMSPLVTRPSLPVPVDLGGIDAGLGGDLAHRRRERRIAARRPSAAAARAAVAAASAFAASAGGGLRRLARRARAFLDLAEQRADRDRLAVLGGDLARARRRPAPAPRSSPCRSRARPAARRPRRVARLLEPVADRRLGDGFAERRDADFSHELSSSLRVMPACPASTLASDRAT